ncbi:MAG: hypothetical protein ACLFNN_00505 [Candidatus Paceibacterota bacterium]
MGKVISFLQYGGVNQKKSEGKELDELLLRSDKLIKKNKDSEKPTLKNKKEVQIFFESIISEEIIKRKKIVSELFLCGNYISRVLASHINEDPEFWITSDYEIKYSQTGKPEYLKEGANTCFLICSVFYKRANWKLMKPSFYKEKGMTLYHQFYQERQEPVCYYMSINFEEAAEITRSAIYNR